MKHILRLNLLLILCSSQIFAQQIIFPTPGDIQNKKGVFVLGKGLKIKGNGPYASKLAFDLLQDLKQYQKQSDVSGAQISLSLSGESEMPNEAYTILVEPNNIMLKAKTETGLFYAKETLLQLARFGKGEINACEIKDKPNYHWRGFMLDESRHFFGKETVKQYLDIMASLRLNVFHWHLTDEPGWRIEIKRYPKLTTEGAIGNWHDPKAPAAYYTQEDIKEIVA